jgi:hypothetical protein
VVRRSCEDVAVAENPNDEIRNPNQDRMTKSESAYIATLLIRLAR